MLDQRQRLNLLLAALPGLLIMLFAWHLASQRALDEAMREGRHRLDMHAANLAATLDQYRYLPYVLSLNHDVLALLDAPADAARRDLVNRYLDDVNTRSHTAALFVTNADGKALASSNWRSPYSFVGNSYAFRPYFLDARAGQPGRFYGIGTTSRDPGYFLSWPIRKLDGNVIGVAVVKVSLSPLEAAWRKGGEAILVSDRHGVAFLSAMPEWKFSSWQPLPGAVQSQLIRTRQYEGATLHPMPLQPRQAGWLLPLDAPALLGGRFLRLDHALPDSGWTLSLLLDMRAWRDGLLTQLAAALASYLALLALWHYRRQRWRRLTEQLAARQALQQAHDNLERKVAERTGELASANQRLSAEIAERQRTEDNLRATRSQLAEASKLAAMGQMAAGIAHEVNQPLSALRTFTENAGTLLERGQPERVADNLQQILQLVDRMAHITGDLKTFARRNRAEQGRADIAAALRGSLRLLEPELSAAGIRASLQLAPDCPPVPGDMTGLEQVFTNLISNALAALRGQPNAVIHFRLECTEGEAVLQVTDNGPGFAETDLPHLFEPFFTTKPRGYGLGLGLAIVQEIMAQSGGDIRAANLPAGGACFTLRWPLKAPHEHH
ncbi:ATP-binding protein [uncultured Aquitalea sp.]|uniref:sensor histidine kinase n=1 Tax=uncultured Aquitalea sp. TaxID=540272 RepID=UPI0025E27130|nr:ATP-binding protein [uncultured Aquitalea sp.]